MPEQFTMAKQADGGFEAHRTPTQRVQSGRHQQCREKVASEYQRTRSA